MVFARAAGSSDKTKFASARSNESRSYEENTMIFENLYIKHVCWTPVGATQIASHTVLLIIRIEETLTSQATAAILTSTGGVHR